MNEQGERTVGDIMSTPVVSATASETIAAAAARMREQKVGSVVIVDGDGRATGILTERDMLRFAAAHGGRDLVLLLIAGFVAALAGLFTPMATGWLIDHAIPSGRARSGP